MSVTTVWTRRVLVTPNVKTTAVANKDVDVALVTPPVLTATRVGHVSILSSISMLSP